MAGHVKQQGTSKVPCLSTGKHLAGTYHLTQPASSHFALYTRQTLSVQPLSPSWQVCSNSTLSLSSVLDGVRRTAKRTSQPSPTGFPRRAWICRNFYCPAAYLMRTSTAARGRVAAAACAPIASAERCFGTWRLVRAVVLVRVPLCAAPCCARTISGQRASCHSPNRESPQNCPPAHKSASLMPLTPAMSELAQIWTSLVCPWKCCS